MKLARTQLSNVALALLALALAAPARVTTSGNVLIVDDDGSAPYATIQAAVDAAQDGDVVLVRTGTHAGFRIADKSLVVLGDLGADVRVEGGIRVVDLAVTRTVVLANLRCTGTADFDPELSPALLLTNAAGSIRVEGCVLTGGGGFHSSHGVRVRSCASVAIDGCDVRAGPATGSSSPIGSDGLAASEASIVTVHGSVLRGGDGLDSGCFPGWGNGAGDGVDVRDSSLFGAGSTFLGGRGGDTAVGLILACPAAGDGGDGIHASNANVRLFDTPTVAGLGGAGIEPGCGGSCYYPGYVGSDRSGASFSELLGDARIVSTTSPGSAGATTTITLDGTAGDEVMLLVANATTPPEFVPGWNGVLLVPRPRIASATRVMRVGALPASGVLGVPLVLPAPSQPGSARTLFVQALFRDAQGRRFLSGVRSLTVLP